MRNLFISNSQLGHLQHPNQVGILINPIVFTNGIGLHRFTQGLTDKAAFIGFSSGKKSSDVISCFPKET